MTDGDRPSIESALIEWLRVALASVDDAVIATDPEGRVTFVNPVAAVLTGWNEPEAKGQPLEVVFKTINQVTRKAVERPPVSALRDGMIVQLADQTVLLTKDGTERRIAGRAAPIHADAGVAGLVMAFRVSERYREGQLVEEALSYANDIIATLREPFLVLDEKLRVQAANRAFYETFHVSQEATLDCLIYELGTGQWNIPGLRLVLQEVASNHHTVTNYDVEHDFPIIGRKQMLLNAARVHRPGNESNLILLAIEDISERRRMERELQAQAMELVDLHRRKDEFLAMLSHELRNPLAPITNAVALLRLQGNEESLQRNALAIIERQVGQLKHLIDDLLEVSRIATGTIRLHQKRVALDGILERALEATRPLIGQRHHELTVNVPKEPIWVYADAARLEQVVVNLLTNAAKYTDDGGHVLLAVHQEGDEAVLRVRDTGVGIAPELLPRIFDMFTQAERSLDRSDGGLGIGLSLVQRLVELHKGRVEATSALGRGSEFVVRLPVLLSTPSVAPSGTETTIPNVESLRVLVVDDNVDAAETLAQLLRSFGHEVRTAFDGQTAVEAALDERPHVLLLDIGLPTMNGYEVAKKLHESGVDGFVLVAVTGYGQEFHRERSIEAGFDHHLIKPVAIETVLQILAEVPATD